MIGWLAVAAVVVVAVVVVVWRVRVACQRADMWVRRVLAESEAAELEAALRQVAHEYEQH